MTALSLLLSVVLAAATLGQPADETRPDDEGAGHRPAPSREGDGAPAADLDAPDTDLMRAEDPDGYSDFAMGVVWEPLSIGENETVEVIIERYPEAHEAWVASMEARLRRVAAEQCERGAWRFMELANEMSSELPFDYRSWVSAYLGFLDVSHSPWQRSPVELDIPAMESALEVTADLNFVQYRRNRTAALRAAAESERRELLWQYAAARAFARAAPDDGAPQAPWEVEGLSLDRLRADLEAMQAATRNAWLRVEETQVAWADRLARADAAVRSVWDRVMGFSAVIRLFDVDFWPTLIGGVRLTDAECAVPMESVRPSLSAEYFQASMMSKFAAFALEIPVVTDDESAALYRRHRRALDTWKKARLATSDLTVAVDEAEAALRCGADPDRCDDRPGPPRTDDLPGQQRRRETGKEKHP